MRVIDLFEIISGRVFHYTRVGTALKILQSGEFELSHTLGTSWEQQYAPKGYPYFLSTTRTRRGGYHDYIGQDAVLFELDGDFYNQRYPGRAVDYWNNRDPLKSHHRPHEAEDRIFSREPAIPAAVRVVDIYIAPDADEAARARARQLMIVAKQRKTSVNLFNDKEAWLMRDTRHVADVSQLRGQDPARGYVSRRRGGYLKPWMELIQAKQKSQLSKDADSKRYALQYTYDKQGMAKSLAVDLSNARKPGPDADRNNAVRVIQFMQQNRLDTVNDLVNFLADKWKNYKEGVAEAVIPSEQLKSSILYHGTPTKAGYDGIAREGLKVNPELIAQKYKGQEDFSPLPGVYMTKEFGNAVRYSFMSEVSDEQYADYIKQEPYGYVFEFSGKNLSTVTPDEDELGSFLEKLVKTKNLPPNLLGIVQSVPQQLRIKLQQSEIDFQTTAVAGKWVVNNISDATMQYLLKKYHNVVNYSSMKPIAVWVIPKPNQRFLRDRQGTFNTHNGYNNYAKRFGKRYILSKQNQGVAEGRKKKRRVKQAAYGPGPYGWYGYDAGYSGELTELFNTQPSKSAAWARPIGQWEDMDQFNFVASNGIAYQVDFLAPWAGPDELAPYVFFEPDEEISDRAYQSAKFVEFEQKSKPGDIGKQGIEGTGAAAEVFGIVTNVMLQYIKKAKPSMLYFQAAEPNRQRLYARMATRVAQAIGWKVKQDGSAHFAIYNPRKIKDRLPNQGVAEGSLDEIYKMPPTKNSSQGMTTWAYNDALEKKSPILYKDNNVIIFKANEDLLRYITLQDGVPVLYIGLSKFLDGYKSGTVATEIAGRGKGLAQKAYLNASDILSVPIYSDTTQTDASRLGIWDKLIQQYPDRIVGYDQKTNKNLPLSLTDKGPTVNQNQPIYVDRNEKDTNKPVGPNQRYRTRILKLLPKKQGVAEDLRDITELRYLGNLGIMELVKFFREYPQYKEKYLEIKNQKGIEAANQFAFNIMKVELEPIT